MRELTEIESDMKELELQIQICELKQNKLLKEMFDSKYVKVSWEQAEKYFLDNPPSNFSSHYEQPHVAYIFLSSDKWKMGRKDYITIIYNEDGTGKEILIGGYRHGYESGEQVFIERKYADKFKSDL